MYIDPKPKVTGWSCPNCNKWHIGYLEDYQAKLCMKGGINMAGTRKMGSKSVAYGTIKKPNLKPGAKAKPGKGKK